MWLVTDLKQRIQIGYGIQTPVSSGSLAFSFQSVLECWSAIKPISDYVKAIRGVNVQDAPSHKMRVRMQSIKNLGKQFSSAYSTGYKVMADLAPVKTKWYVKMKQRDVPQGRLFKVIGLDRDDNFSEWIDLTVQEVSEMGTGRNPL